MPLYSVLIEGFGVDFPADDGSRVRGFFVTRLAKASNEAEAASVGQARVTDEWANGKYSSLDCRPKLRVSKVKRLGLLDRFTVNDTGYVFHPDEIAG